jgi:hypothetical protein
MEKYKEIIRTTVGNFLSDGTFTTAGIYVIACYPALGCIYIGRSNDIRQRMRWHLTKEEPLGNFLRNNMADACAWRFDILIPPNENIEWLIKAETLLTKKLMPMLAERLL